MKKIIFQIVFIALIGSILPAFGELVNISVGPQYTNQIWYDLTSNTQTTIPLASWDIAFFSYNQNASIRINSGAGARLWEILGKTYDDFDSNIDTTGLTSNPEKFVEWYNSDTTWTVGAFNRGRDGFETEGDFGWGNYDMNTHAIVGDKLYIYRSIEGKYYIFTIQDLISGTYTFKYRDLNTSDAITREFSKSSTTSKLFGYYSISSDKFLDLEPLKSDWYLLFSKYIAMISDDSGNIVPYSVMGVLTNYELPVVKVENIPPENAELPDLSTFSTNISTIGHTWKKFDMQNGWSLVPNLSYFIQRDEDFFYHIYFTAFGGSSTGNITFNSDVLIIDNVKEAFESSNTFILAPSIIEPNSAFDILFNANSTTTKAELTLYTITGEIVLTHNLNLVEGLNAFSIPNNLVSGMYIVSLNINGHISAQKLIVK